MDYIFLLEDFIDNEFPFDINFGTHYKDFRIHTHNYYELTIIIDGNATHIVEESTYALKKGDIYLIKPCYSHGITDVNNLAQYNIAFDINKLMLLNSELKNLPGFKALFIAEPYYKYEQNYTGRLKIELESLDFISLLCDNMINEYEKKDIGYEFIIKSYFYSLLGFLIRNIIIETDLMSDLFYKISDAIMYIENNYNKKINISRLADTVYLSVRQFDRIFKKVYSVTPIEYIINCRLNHVCNYMMNKNYSLSKISEQCGFNDVSHMSRMFKKKYGLTPGEYRNNLHL